MGGGRRARGDWESAVRFSPTLGVDGSRAGVSIPGRMKEARGVGDEEREGSRRRKGLSKAPSLCGVVGTTGVAVATGLGGWPTPPAASAAAEEAE